MTDYAKEIYKLIAGNLPLTEIELGTVLPATSVNINSNKVLLTLSSSDYSFVKSQISDALRALNVPLTLFLPIPPNVTH